MADMVSKERKLKSLVRKINAKIYSSPVSLLTDADEIPDFKKMECELAQLLEDLDLSVTRVCKDHEAQLGLMRIYG